VQELVVGMQLHQGQLMRVMCGSVLAQAGTQLGSSSTAQQQQRQEAQQQQRGPPAASSAATTGSRSSSSSSKVFTVTTRDIKTVPQLLQLFETGWPLTTPDKIFTGLAEPAFARGLPGNQAQQYELLRQGYLLVKGVAQQYDINTGKAAAVVEIWRDNTAASIDADGSIAVAEPADTAVVAGRTVVASLLPPKDKRWTLNNLCQTARGLACVTAQKHSAKSAAGRQGGSAQKKQRRE
jgi:hypothetical protein